MTRFYDWAARVCGACAVVCAVLTLLASPATTRADDLSYCQGQCAGLPVSEQMKCVGDCMSLQSQCPGKVDAKGMYVGCQSPGQACTYGGKASTCGDAPGGKNCTCLGV